MHLSDIDPNSHRPCGNRRALARQKQARDSFGAHAGGDMGVPVFDSELCRHTAVRAIHGRDNSTREHERVCVCEHRGGGVEVCSCFPVKTSSL